MTVAAVYAPARPRIAPLIFASATFVSAALVFTLEPMIAKMILPRLGGSPAVWNTCIAFFQAALLVGYVYAYLLQRYLPVRLQVPAHLTLLAAAILVLPVKITPFLGAAPLNAPVAWLFGVLIISVGAPFAVLSATAPLLQAWYARVQHDWPEANNPYILYVASNLGSMLALLAYPAGVEPFLVLPVQTLAWAGVYLAFCVLIVAAGVLVWPIRPDIAVPVVAAAKGDAITWSRRLLWVLLAAGPSSLLLGATTYISNDVASVPLFWIVPLALYLLTFVIAFQTKPMIRRERALLWQAASVAVAVPLLSINSNSLIAHLLVFLGALFFTALVCHQRLSASRPHPRHLTEFYMLTALGGAVGGMFNALLAPMLFNSILEFPLVLVLCGLARPWNGAALDRRTIEYTVLGVAAVIGIALAPPANPLLLIVFAILGGIAVAAVSKRGLLFTVMTGVLCGQAVLVPPDKRTNLTSARSFFGVHRVILENEPSLGGTLHLLFHGTTIHGAQPEAAKFRCEPTTYYSRLGPLGVTLASVLTTKPQANIGVVGLGAGTLATYMRPGSHLRYFEIDPEVERLARDRNYFTYLSDCAKGNVDVTLGDARLTIAREPAHSYDLIEVDAFSADNVPTHLLTTQALEIYFRALKPDGILVLHLSNRNLRLEPPAAAAAKAVGATALMQEFRPPAGVAPIAASPTQAMVMSKSPAALIRFAHDPKWRKANDHGVPPWTDDYTNIIGAMIDQATWKR